jgi:hypothetical protein
MKEKRKYEQYVFKYKHSREKSIEFVGVFALDND